MRTKTLKNLHPINQTDQAWLDKLYRKSKTDRTRIIAGISLKNFDIFCEYQEILHLDTFMYVESIVRTEVSKFNLYHTEILDMTGNKTYESILKSLIK